MRLLLEKAIEAANNKEFLILPTKFDIGQTVYIYPPHGPQGKVTERGAEFEPYDVIAHCMVILDLHLQPNGEIK